MNQLLKDHIHFKDEIVRLQAAFITGWLMKAATSKILSFLPDG